MDNFFTEINPDPEPSSGSGKKTTTRRFLLDFLETLLLSAGLFLIINTISARVRVESVSMQPTLFEGDFVFVNRLAYKLGEPSTGDIIVFKYPPDPQREPYIKRVVGVPGDTIRISDGEVYINNRLLNEPYIKMAPNYAGSWTVPEKSLFVLGDNRNSSSDSHIWGLVPLDNVIGKAEAIYLPFDRWQVLDPRVASAASSESKDQENATP